MAVFVRSLATTLQNLCILLIVLFIVRIDATTPMLRPYDVLSLSNTQCVVAVVKPICNGTEQRSKMKAFANLLRFADVAFHNETKIRVGTCNLERFVWPSGKSLKLDDRAGMHELKAVVFAPIQKDRTCLHKPARFEVHPTAFGYNGPSGSFSANPFVDFINKHCNTFRKIDGNYNIKGYHKVYLRANMFHVQKDLPQTYVTVSKLIKKQGFYRKSNAHCLKGPDNGERFCPAEMLVETSSLKYDDAPHCERIPMPTKNDFISNYLSRSKPVIITGAMNDWTAMKNWTTEFFRKKYGKREVHVKLTPRGEYEGVEPARLWDSHGSFKIPPEVLKQLPYPDLVVVRPAGVNMKFSEFLDLMGNISEGTLKDVSAYLEYASMGDISSKLKRDVAEMPFFKNFLKLAHMNMWLSDGNTLGKTHFDPFDNFLCQISGQKQVTLFEPHNDYLYEAHIPEAVLTYNATLKQFRRSKLMDSTSMVMSPVDIQNPQLERFPKFGSARPMSCTIREGEVLFLPAFWWHEVRSRPSITQHRNLAVNFWYEPFFTKEFPCQDCQFDVNPKYNHLL